MKRYQFQTFDNRHNYRVLKTTTISASRPADRVNSTSIGLLKTVANNVNVPER
jgi:hypothetical protein